MKVWRRTLPAAAIAIAVILPASGHLGGGIHTAHAQAVKNTTRITMYDSNVTFNSAGIEYQGQWGFGPVHVAVTQGDQVEFDNPASNIYGHTVTSITWSGSPSARVLASGTAFNSSPTSDTVLKPGDSWTLDTSTLTPGQYLYYCTVHPWMTGTISVEAPAS